MPDIENYQVYNDRMRQSMWDKAFFMDKIPGTVLLIDYGCADGSLIQFLQELFSDMLFIGFDIDPVMIEAARNRQIRNAWFFAAPSEVQEKIRELRVPPSGIAINYSSVLHEVFHYGYDLKTFTAFIRTISPQYLVVRDMMYLSGNPDAAVPEKAVRSVRSVLPARQIRDFENIWGPITLRKNLIHFLLKYNYTENWERECAENYFSYTQDQLMQVLNPEGKYRCILFFRYLLPWIRYNLEKKFSIDPGNELTTHYAMILSAGNPSGLISLNESRVSGKERI